MLPPSAVAFALALVLAAPAGAATFAKTDYPISPKTGQTSMRAESLAVADLNKDGKPDIAVLDALVQNNLVSVFLNNGDGTFAGAVQHADGCASDPSNLVAGEFDTPPDSNPDVMLVCAPHVVELPGDGSGGFGAPIEYVNTNVAGPLAVGPFDRNGHADLGWNATGGHLFCFTPISSLATSGGAAPTCDSGPNNVIGSGALVLAPLGEQDDHTPRAIAFGYPSGGGQTLRFFADTSTPC